MTDGDVVMQQVPAATQIVLPSWESMVSGHPAFSPQGSGASAAELNVPLGSASSAMSTGAGSDTPVVVKREPDSSDGPMDLDTDPAAISRKATAILAAAALAPLPPRTLSRVEQECKAKIEAWRGRLPLDPMATHVPRSVFSPRFMTPHQHVLLGDEVPATRPDTMTPNYYPIDDSFRALEYSLRQAGLESSPLEHKHKWLDSACFFAISLVHSGLARQVMDTLLWCAIREVGVRDLSLLPILLALVKKFEEQLKQAHQERQGVFTKRELARRQALAAEAAASTSACSSAPGSAPVKAAASLAAAIPIKQEEEHKVAPAPAPAAAPAKKSFSTKHATIRLAAECPAAITILLEMVLRVAYAPKCVLGDVAPKCAIFATSIIPGVTTAEAAKSKEAKSEAKKSDDGAGAGVPDEKNFAALNKMISWWMGYMLHDCEVKGSATPTTEKRTQMHAIAATHICCEVILRGNVLGRMSLLWDTLSDIIKERIKQYRQPSAGTDDPAARKKMRERYRRIAKYVQHLAVYKPTSGGPAMSDAERRTLVMSAMLAVTYPQLASWSMEEDGQLPRAIAQGSHEYKTIEKWSLRSAHPTQAVPYIPRYFAIPQAALRPHCSPVVASESEASTWLAEQLHLRSDLIDRIGMEGRDVPLQLALLASSGSNKKDELDAARALELARSHGRYSPLADEKVTPLSHEYLVFRALPLVFEMEAAFQRTVINQMQTLPSKGLYPPSLAEEAVRRWMLQIRPFVVAHFGADILGQEAVVKKRTKSKLLALEMSGAGGGSGIGCKRKSPSKGSGRKSEQKGKGKQPAKKRKVGSTKAVPLDADGQEISDCSAPRVRAAKLSACRALQRAAAERDPDSTESGSDEEEEEEDDEEEEEEQDDDN